MTKYYFLGDANSERVSEHKFDIVEYMSTKHNDVEFTRIENGVKFKIDNSTFQVKVTRFKNDTNIILMCNKKFDIPGREIRVTNVPSTKYRVNINDLELYYVFK